MESRLAEPQGEFSDVVGTATARDSRVCKQQTNQAQNHKHT